MVTLSFWSLFYRSYYNFQIIRSYLSFVNKNEILNEKSRILKLVPEYVNDQLTSSKHNIYEHTREEYEQSKSIDKILELLHLSVDEYDNNLAISEDDDFQIYLRLTPNFCFVKNTTILK